MPGATVDITDRKRIEDALNENRSFLTDILRSSGEAFYAVDRKAHDALQPGLLEFAGICQ